jgi:hypothetical protein
VASALDKFYLEMVNVRTVKARREPPSRPGAGNYVAEPLLMVADQLAWPEDNLTDDPALILENYQATRESLNKILEKRGRMPPTVGVTVSEAGGTPEHFQSRPRMVVIGTADFLSDDTLSRESKLSDLNYTLFSGCLSWLREKPNSIGVASRQPKFYQPSNDTNYSRMVWLPTGLMVFCIVGLGLGVWVVRRR